MGSARPRVGTLCRTDASAGLLIAMSDGINYTYPTVRSSESVVMRSKIEIYRAKATECEVRAQEMPPGLRRTVLTLAEYWRKLAFDAADAADRRRKQMQETADRRKKRTKVS
jgi:hypothetical protein